MHNSSFTNAKKYKLSSNYRFFKTQMKELYLGTEAQRDPLWEKSPGANMDLITGKGR